MKQFFLSALISSFAFGLTTYTDAKSGVSVKYDEKVWEVVEVPTAPAKEQVDTSMAEQTLVTLQRKVADDKYRARFSIVTDNAAKVKPVDAAKEPLDKLKAYKAHSVAFMKSQRFDILLEELMKFQAQREAFQIVANQRDFGLTFKQIGFLVGDTAYLITATARTAKYESYVPEMNALFASVSIK